MDFQNDKESSSCHIIELKEMDRPTEIDSILILPNSSSSPILSNSSNYRPAPPGLTLKIANVPTNMNERKFAQLVKSHGIVFKKVDKPHKKSIARIRFDNHENKQYASKILDGLKIDGGKSLIVKFFDDSIPLHHSESNHLITSVNHVNHSDDATLINMNHLGHENKPLNDPELSSSGNKKLYSNLDEEIKEVAFDSPVAKRSKHLLLEEDTLKMESALSKCNILDQVTPWHNIEYSEQLKRKVKSVERVLEKILSKVRKDSQNQLPEWLIKMDQMAKKLLQPKQLCPIEPIIPSPIIYGYRNKSEFTIGRNISGKMALGFLTGSWKDGFIHVANPCLAPNLNPLHKEIHQLIEKWISNYDIDPWNRETRTGFWRLLLIRSNLQQEAMIMFQVNPQFISPEKYSILKDELIQYISLKDQPAQCNICSIWIQEHDGISNVASNDAPLHLLWGVPYINEVLLNTNFRISPTSFFQVNTLAAGKLYYLVREWCGNLNNDRVLILDICCGTGTIGICLAKNAVHSNQKIIGFELVDSAVEDARINAEFNHIQNARFVVGKVEETLKMILSEFQIQKSSQLLSPITNNILDSTITSMDPNIDTQSSPTAHHSILKSQIDTVIAIVDPPRSGLHSKCLRALRECNLISLLIYISCNPNSLIHDASVLTRFPSKSTPGAPFIPITCRPIDMFPHTEHVELVMMFQRQ